MTPGNRIGPAGTGPMTKTMGQVDGQGTPPLRWKGLRPATLEAAGVRVGRDRVRVPYRAADGTPHAVRVFRRDGRPWWEPRGVELIPYGLETLPPHASAAVLFVCEGESDTLVVREALPRWCGHPAYSIGLPGARIWRPEWAVYLEPFALVYVLGDGDEPGRAMAWNVRGDVPWVRPVALPDREDARALLQRLGPYALDPYVAEADRDALIEEAFQRPSLDAAIAFLRGEEELRRVA